MSDDLNHDLNLFSVWCCTNRVTINVKKTKVVVFSKRSFFNLHPLYLSREIVDVVSEYTCLGFLLDENLSFASHASQLIQSSTTKIRRYINCETAVVIFKSFILPKLEYGDIFSCGVTRKFYIGFK